MMFAYSSRPDGSVSVTTVASSKSANVTGETMENLLESHSTYGRSVWASAVDLTSASPVSGVVKPSSGVAPLAPKNPTVK